MMLLMWELEQFLTKRDILWLSLVRSSMGQRKNTPHMILNSMRWCKQLGIVNIISVIRNLFCIWIMKSCDILILKRSLTLDKQNGVVFFSYLFSILAQCFKLKVNS